MFVLCFDLIFFLHFFFGKSVFSTIIAQHLTMVLNDELHFPVRFLCGRARTTQNAHR